MGALPQQTMFFPNQMPYAGFPQQHVQHDMIPHAFGPFSDFPEGMYFAEYDDCNEVTTRPRLTKEQVDILENEFQRNSKPNSGTKRHLAQVTNLNLPRVANWFQNRRAKAKQQRKQEEFESAQKQMAASKQGAGQKSTDDDDDEEDEEEPNQESEVQDGQQSAASTTDEETKIQSSPSPTRGPTRPEVSISARDRADASLRRAIAAAEAMHKAQTPKSVAEEPKPERPSSPIKRSQNQAQPQPLPQFGDWARSSELQTSWLPSPTTGCDMSFDFGFNGSDAQLLPEHAILPSPADSTSQGFKSPEAWESNAITPTMANHHHSQIQHPITSSGISMSSYVGSRRPSAADTLTNNFNDIEIANVGPRMSFQTSGSVSSSASENGTDLASRRRRPRPAALVSASLRSRSYGALTAASPTFRQGMTPPTTQTLRHVKSTGHSLNGHYAGIRKSSIPQKSPLHYSFAEAEAFQQLMAQKAKQNETKQALSPVETCSMALSRAQEHVMAAMAQQNTSLVDLPPTTLVQSPPVTPFNQSFFGQPPSMLATSIQQQYASASETPPYSAGPMTNTSWDFPLTSPDVASFPQTSLLPNMPFTTAGEDAALNAWMCASDHSPACGGGTSTGHRDAEWYIHEFPGQKEELAHTTQLLDRPAPRHYAFENRGQQDFAL